MAVLSSFAMGSQMLHGSSFAGASAVPDRLLASVRTVVPLGLPAISFGRRNLVLSRNQTKWSVVRSAVDEQESSSKKISSTAMDEKLENSTTNGAVGSRTSVDKKAVARAEIERGRNTAIITGAISVLLGVGYLLLTQFLDTRGIQLVPPPPEALVP